MNQTELKARQNKAVLTILQFIKRHSILARLDCIDRQYLKTGRIASLITLRLSERAKYIIQVRNKCLYAHLFSPEAIDQYWQDITWKTYYTNPRMTWEIHYRTTAKLLRTNWVYNPTSAKYLAINRYIPLATSLEEHKNHGIRVNWEFICRNRRFTLAELREYRGNIYDRMDDIVVRYNPYYIPLWDHVINGTSIEECRPSGMEHEWSYVVDTPHPGDVDKRDTTRLFPSYLSTYKRANLLRSMCVGHDRATYIQRRWRLHAAARNGRMSRVVLRRMDKPLFIIQLVGQYFYA